MYRTRCVPDRPLWLLRPVRSHWSASAWISEPAHVPLLCQGCPSHVQSRHQDETETFQFSNFSHPLPTRSLISDRDRNVFVSFKISNYQQRLTEASRHGHSTVNEYADYTVQKSRTTRTETLIAVVQCESKKVAPLKLFVVFSVLVNLCNWKLAWLLLKHIPMSTPILVHLSEYLCKICHF